MKLLSSLSDCISNRTLLSSLRGCNSGIRLLSSLSGYNSNRALLSPSVVVTLVWDFLTPSVVITLVGGSLCLSVVATLVWDFLTPSVLITLVGGSLCPSVVVSPRVHLDPLVLPRIELRYPAFLCSRYWDWHKREYSFNKRLYSPARLHDGIIQKNKLLTATPRSKSILWTQ